MLSYVNLCFPNQLNRFRCGIENLSNSTALGIIFTFKGEGNNQIQLLLWLLVGLFVFIFFLFLKMVWYMVPILTAEKRKLNVLTVELNFVYQGEVAHL